MKMSHSRSRAVTCSLRAFVSCHGSGYLSAVCLTFVFVVLGVTTFAQEAKAAHAGSFSALCSSSIGRPSRIP